MVNERVCGYCPRGSCETVEGNGINAPLRRTVIRCPFNPEFPRNPLDICAHLRRREEAGYKFDAGTVAQLLDLCRTHDIEVQMEYRRPSDAYLLTFTKNGKRIYIDIPTEKLEQSESPENVLEHYVNTALCSILSENAEKTVSDISEERLKIGDSESSEQRSWADQAKMRANRTVSNYNNYILKNSYVWDGNIPEDILSELEIVQ